MIHEGRCHCGAIGFTVVAPADINVSRCNCSICAMTGFIHLIVKKDDFILLRGENNLANYSFNTGIAQHLFCKTCGVKSFYVPRSHPDGYSINLNCLDRNSFESITIRDFDGKKWEENISDLTDDP